MASRWGNDLWGTFGHSWRNDMGQVRFVGTGVFQERPAWEARYLMKEHRRAGKATFQGQVYNFLERPSGWKCFVYHFSV
ncbi:Uncharacterized protein GBIM_14844 [Gryllus bimaculatus]|nr:Uncharacterized protein GBIM_14844 [Gryllus bimaculatus]